MYRLVSSKFFRFSTEYYHPCKFMINSEYAEKYSCNLAFYFDQFRKHGHHYAKLDPLGIYNK